MRKTVYFQLRGAEFSKWEIIKTYGNGTAIVINSFKEAGGITTAVYPYKTPKNKIHRFFKFKWLQFRVWLKIIK